MRDASARMPIGDVELEAALRDLGGELAIPSLYDRETGLDPAARARARIVFGGVPRRWGRWWLADPAGLPLRRAVALAAIAVLAVAVIAGALGLGLPGIRIIQAPTASPGASGGAPSGVAPSGSSAVQSASPPPGTSPTISGPPGTGMGLGDPIAVADASAAVDIPIALPTAPGVGPPITAWILDGRLSFVWPASRTLPPTREPGIGLILSEFRGSVEPDYFQKILDPDTTLTPVTVGDVTGYWISGAPHQIVFVDRYGQPVFDSRRIVGDTLLWARGDVTYRLESGLGRDAAIALAESLR
jgi:hypothetical protein